MYMYYYCNEDARERDLGPVGAELSFLELCHIFNLFSILIRNLFPLNLA